MENTKFQIETVNYNDFDNDDQMFEIFFNYIYDYKINNIIIYVAHENGLLTIIKNDNEMTIVFERNDDDDRGIIWSDLNYKKCEIEFEEFMEQFDLNFYNIMNK